MFHFNSKWRHTLIGCCLPCREILETQKSHVVFFCQKKEKEKKDDFWIIPLFIEKVQSLCRNQTESGSTVKTHLLLFGWPTFGAAVRWGEWKTLIQLARAQWEQRGPGQGGPPHGHRNPSPSVEKCGRATGCSRTEPHGCALCSLLSGYYNRFTDGLLHFQLRLQSQWGCKLRSKNNR